MSAQHTPLSFTIVTCSFQQGRFLDATMRSVFNQSYPALEYIVMDGGSNDGSAEIIAGHAERLGYWISEADKGQTDALQRGFARATGDLMGWLCSDDLLLPGALRAVADYFQAHPQVDAVYGDALWIDADGGPLRCKREMGFNRFVFLHDHNFVPQPSMFWRRSLYERVGGLNPQFNLAMDSDLWDRFAQHTRIAHMGRYLSCMRYYPEQKTRSLKPAAQREDLSIRLRGSALAHVAALRSPLRVAARGIRLLSKGLAGGYGAKLPTTFDDWLASHATPVSGRD